MVAGVVPLRTAAIQTGPTERFGSVGVPPFFTVKAGNRQTRVYVTAEALLVLEVGVGKSKQFGANGASVGGALGGMLGALIDEVVTHRNQEKMRARLQQLDLADRATHFPDDLSGGERQRVAIARAVVGERWLVLADEPTGALDSVNGEVVMRLLRDATRRGVACVVVTHEAQLASWADRVVFLRDGRLVDQTGPAAGPESLLGSAAGIRP